VNGAILSASAAAVKNVLALELLVEKAYSGPELGKLLEDAEYMKPMVESNEADGKTCDPRLKSHRIEGKGREAG
jgi:hypothetical protein